LAYHFPKEEYVKYFERNFSLSENGEIINYFYDMSKENINEFEKILGNNGYIEEIGGNKLLVYKKTN
jgi:hypothetical protein